nr:PREDICTED: macoilin-1-like [Latimeria chalumnae]|eukprot:XP_014346877.1 PREDICTED: macoilin-1-like [Latimeria chalumnae]
MKDECEEVVFMTEMTDVNAQLLRILQRCHRMYLDMRGDHWFILSPSKLVIGYPVVYLGFDATCYITSIIKSRIQSEVQKENEFYTQLLQQALPSNQPIYLRYDLECKEESKWMSNAEKIQYQHQNPRGTTVEKKYPLPSLEPESKDKGKDKDMEGNKQNDHALQTAGLKTNKADKENCTNTDLNWELCASTESLPQEEHGAKSSKNLKSSSPQVQKKVNNSSTAPIIKSEKRLKYVTKNNSPNRETYENGCPSDQNIHADTLLRLEHDVKKIKTDLQLSRQNEQDLRGQLCYLTNNERTLRSELLQFRQENELLQNKIQCFMQAKHKDKYGINQLEKKLRAEMETRAIFEKQLTEATRKLDESIVSARFNQLSTNNRQECNDILKSRIKDLENEYKHLHMELKAKDDQIRKLESEMEGPCKYKENEQDTVVLFSALSAMQDKTQQLETSLSAETRIKLDLFSALGDARRQLEIAQGKVIKQDQEIVELKQKIAEVMAVMPGISYAVTTSFSPHYLSTFLDSENSVLGSSASIYQPLKK